MSIKNDYLLLLRNTDWDEGLSVEEVAEAIDQYTAWMDQKVQDGIITGGQPLLAGGRVVVAGPGGRVTDGPFIESKEAIGGYLQIRARDYAEAVEIAKAFPPVARGVQIEIRELTLECPVSQRLQLRLEKA